MLPSDIWQIIGSPQLAELTALGSLSLPFLLKLKKHSSPQKIHIKKSL